jgi:hypothetical protein
MVQARVRAAGLEMLPQPDLMRSGPQPFNGRSKSILAALDDLPDGDADILAVLVGVGLWRAERTPQGEPALQAGAAPVRRLQFGKVWSGTALGARPVGLSSRSEGTVLADAGIGFGAGGQCRGLLPSS